MLERSNRSLEEELGDAQMDGQESLLADMLDVIVYDGLAARVGKPPFAVLFES